MDALYIISTYCLIDDTLRLMGHRDHHHAQLSTAEVLTVAVIAAKYFQNHHERTVAVLALTGYIRPISRSRFNRRLHQAGEWLALILDYWGSQRLAAGDYVVDTMPLPVCHKSRAEQCRKIPQVTGYIGRCAAKNEWFCGWRLHWVCDAAGFPIAFDLVPAVWHELTTLQNLIAPLPPGATVYGDGAYLSFDHQALALLGDIQLVVETHPRLLQQNTPLQRRLLKKHRSRIESQHSVLEKMGVQRLHAVTAVGFGLKVYASLLALAVNLLVA